MKVINNNNEDTVDLSSSQVQHQEGTMRSCGAD
jgi:hypothetical protein